MLIPLHSPGFEVSLVVLHCLVDRFVAIFEFVFLDSVSSAPFAPLRFAGFLVVSDLPLVLLELASSGPSLLVANP